MKKIYLGLIEFGNVGSGVVKILKSKKSYLRNKLGCDLILKKICDKDLTSKRGVSIPRDILTSDPRKIIDDPSIDIVIELIGGIHPAKEIIMYTLFANYYNYHRQNEVYTGKRLAKLETAVAEAQAQLADNNIYKSITIVLSDSDVQTVTR